MIRSNWKSPLSTLGRLSIIPLLIAAVGCSGMDHSGHSQDAEADSAAVDQAHSAAHDSTTAAAPASKDKTGQADHAQSEHDHAGHDHAPLAVPADQPAPTLAIAVTPDPVSGWNLELQTTNFEFAPERVNGESTFNEGHAHLMVNGEKRGRIYSNWHHLTDLTPGENMVMVTLNANGHEELTVEGEVVADSVLVTVP
ncbi:MAG: hypothetical protein AAFR42_07610 [Cyanobacteria bacterium J06628_6]